MLTWLCALLFGAVACIGCGAMMVFDPAGVYIAVAGLVGLCAAVVTLVRRRSS